MHVWLQPAVSYPAMLQRAQGETRHTLVYTILSGGRVVGGTSARALAALSASGSRSGAGAAVMEVAGREALPCQFAFAPVETQGGAFRVWVDSVPAPTIDALEVR